MAEMEPRLSRRLARRRRWAGMMLTAERLLEAFAPAVALPLGFLAVSLMGWWRYLPWWLHAAALLAVVVAWAWTLRRGWRRFRTPTAGDVDRGLDRVPRPAHRPIATLADPAHHSVGLGEVVAGSGSVRLTGSAG